MLSTEERLRWFLCCRGYICVAFVIASTFGVVLDLTKYLVDDSSAEAFESLFSVIDKDFS